MTAADRARCRCGHREGTHMWAGDLGGCNVPGCRCQVYQRRFVDERDRRDDAAQRDVIAKRRRT